MHYISTRQNAAKLCDDVQLVKDFGRDIYILPLNPLFIYAAVLG